MLKLFWREMPVPENMRIRQIYGVPFSSDGKTYERVLASPEKVKQLLNWGEIGRKIIDCAVNVAKEKYHLQFDGSNDEIFV